jgi:hypothetical protein
MMSRAVTNGFSKAKRLGDHSEAFAEICQLKADCHRPVYQGYDDEEVVILVLLSAQWR